MVIKYQTQYDLPSLKKGALFEWDDDLDLYINNNIQPGYAFSKEQVEEDPYWFRKVIVTLLPILAKNHTIVKSDGSPWTEEELEGVKDVINTQQ